MQKVGLGMGKLRIRNHGTSGKQGILGLNLGNACGKDVQKLMKSRRKFGTHGKQIMASEGKTMEIERGSIGTKECTLGG